MIEPETELNSEMSYVVKEITSAAKLIELSQVSKIINYPGEDPPPDQPDGWDHHVAKEVVSGCLALLHITAQQESASFKGHLKSLFGHHHGSNSDYQIIVQQTVTKPQRMEVAFLLYESGNYVNTKRAFRELQVILSPLLRDGSVIVTEGLLRAIVLPNPCSPGTAITNIIEMMQTKPDAHPEWHKVVQALLHFACMREDRKQVELLIEKGGKLDQPNYLGYTPINSARTSLSKEGMKWLLSIAKLKLKDNNGHLLQSPSPVEADSGTIKSLFTSHAVPLLFAIPEEITPLHYAAECDDSEKIWEIFKKEEVSTLMHQRRHVRRHSGSTLKRSNNSLNVIDKYGKTALMISVEKGYLQSSMYLLLGGADPNRIQHSSGDTPLHSAVRSGILSLVQLLLVFDADPLIENKDGKTPLQLAKEIKMKNSITIVKVLEEMVNLQKQTEAYFTSNISRPTPRNSSDTFLLSMDGGGVRSFNSVQALIAVEKRMRQLDPGCRPLVSYFDYLAGTSSGAISNLVLAYVDDSLQVGQALLYKVVTDIFQKSLSERGARMDQFLQEILGEETVMSDLKDQRVIVMSTLADRNPCVLHIISNYGESRDEQKGPDERKVWEAARITSAAPIYFPSFEDKFLDGGLMANNPTVDAIVEIMQQSKREKKTVKLGLVLSVGTGVSPSKKVENIDTFMPGVSLKTMLTIPDAVKGLSSLLKMLLTEITQSDGQHALRAEMWCESIGADYFRLSPPLITDIEPSITSIDVLIDMLYHSKKYILCIPDQIDEIARCILSK